MQARAQKKFIRSSPRKMRLVVDLIRGKDAATALTTLNFLPKLAAKDVEMVLKSAVSNLSNIVDGKKFRPEEVTVKEIFVDQGPTTKRIRPAPMGRAYRVRKRSNHLTIIVATQE